MKNLAVKQGGYVCRDGVWYVGYDVVAPNGEKMEDSALKEVQVVERGYVCQDGVWFRQVAAEMV